MRKTQRLLLLVVASVAVVISGSSPALADHMQEHTVEQINEVVVAAGEDMDAIVSGFTADAAGIADEGQVDEAADQARAEIELAWTGARAGIDELSSLFPAGMGQVKGGATQQLQAARQAARSAISSVVDSWVPSVPALPPTTTLPPGPTTTGATDGPAGPVPGSDGSDPAQGSGPHPGQEHGKGPNSNPGNGSGPESNPGTGRDDPAAEVVSDPGASAMTGGKPGVASVATAPEQSRLSVDFAAAPPAQPFTVDPDAITTLLAAEDTGSTAMMAAMLETVLSPAVVDLVLSPLLVLEILIRTLIEGGSTLVAPFALLAVSAAAVFGYEQLSRRDSEVGVDGLEPPTPAL